MLSGVVLGWLCLAGRALTLGLLHPLLKRLNESRGSLAVMALFSFFGLLISLGPAAWSLAQDSSQLDGFAGWGLYPFIGSLTFAVGMVIFNRALRKGDLSLLSPLTALTFVFVYVLDLLVGNRQLAWGAVAGVGVVTLGMALLNLRRGTSVWRSLAPLAIMRQPGAWGAVLFAATLAVGRVVDNEGSKHTGALVYAGLAHLMVFVLVFAAVLLRGQWHRLLELGRGHWGLALLIAALGFFNYLFLIYAYRWFPPSTIEPVSQLGIVLSVLIGVAIYREPLHLRWLAALLFVAGVALVASAP